METNALEQWRVKNINESAQGPNDKEQREKPPAGCGCSTKIQAGLPCASPSVCLRSFSLLSLPLADGGGGGRRAAPAGPQQPASQSHSESESVRAECIGLHLSLYLSVSLSFPSSAGRNAAVKKSPTFVARWPRFTESGVTS